MAGDEAHAHAWWGACLPAWAHTHGLARKDRSGGMDATLADARQRTTPMMSMPCGKLPSRPTASWNAAAAARLQLTCASAAWRGVAWHASLKVRHVSEARGPEIRHKLQTNAACQPPASHALARRTPNSYPLSHTPAISTPNSDPLSHTPAISAPNAYPLTRLPSRPLTIPPSHKYTRTITHTRHPPAPLSWHKDSHQASCLCLLPRAPACLPPLFLPTLFLPPSLPSPPHPLTHTLPPSY
eukprot:365823-Chlamydomonas_euryale.AAC.17